MDKINNAMLPWKAQRLLGWRKIYHILRVAVKGILGLDVCFIEIENKKYAPVFLQAPRAYSACKHALELLDYHGTDDPAFVMDGYVAFPKEKVDELYDELYKIISSAQEKLE